MRVLLDEMVPIDLAPYLRGQEVGHVIHLGWRHKSNGVLLAAAKESGFEVLITKDTNIPYQQSMTGRSISLIVLRPSSQALGDLLRMIPMILAALDDVQPGTVRFLRSD